MYKKNLTYNNNKIKNIAVQGLKIKSSNTA